MKRENSQMDDVVRNRLLERLEAERQAGIPSVPEKLMPEYIGELLEKKRSGRFPFYIARTAGGGLAMVIAAAVLGLILLPTEKNSGCQTAGSAVMPAATTMAAADVVDGAADCAGNDGVPEAAMSWNGSYAAVTEKSLTDTVEEAVEETYQNQSVDQTEAGNKIEEPAARRGLKRPERAVRPENFMIREYRAR